MRLSMLSVLVLLAATPWAPRPSAQGGQGAPPPSRPFVPPDKCFRQVQVTAPFDNQFARLLTGDKWISGCIGPQGPCTFSIWVPC
jgi:hypothetical protein